MMAALIGRPWRVALLTLVAYTLLLVPLAASRHFDLTVFILAGDVYANSATATPPIAIMHHSLGYDGQFFYRFALDPFSVARSAFGITLDTPAKRMLRIIYPLLAWLASFGHAKFVPASLIAVNLAGMGVIAATTSWLTRRHRLAWWFPFAVTLWPGFLVALTHDTAEIVTAALLLVAVACYLSNRLAAYCLFAAAAALTRETALPVLAGVLAYEAYIFAKSPVLARRPARVVLCGLPFVPFAVWWRTMAVIWHQPPQALGGNQDLGWPLVGVVTMLRACIDGTRHYNPDPSANFTTRGFVLLTTGGLICFCIMVAIRLPRTLRTPGLAGFAIGWGLLAGLMSLLTATGPLVEPMSYLRAFSECWVIGCLLLARAHAAGAVRRPLALAGLLLGAELNIVIWKWSLWLLTQ
jgi:hypothetical protein